MARQRRQRCIEDRAGPALRLGAVPGEGLLAAPGARLGPGPGAVRGTVLGEGARARAIGGFGATVDQIPSDRG